MPDALEEELNKQIIKHYKPEKFKATHAHI
jgi:hypothetical protein